MTISSDRQLDAIATQLETARETHSVHGIDLFQIYGQLESLRKELQPGWRGSVMSLNQCALKRSAQLDSVTDLFVGTFGLLARECIGTALRGDTSLVVQLVAIAAEDASSELVSQITCAVDMH